MDQDDLPPQQEAPQEPTAAGALGRLVGSLVWLGLFLAVAGGALFLLIHWTR